MTLLSILILSLFFGAVIGTIAAFWLSFEFIQVAESRIEKTESKSEKIQSIIENGFEVVRMQDPSVSAIKKTENGKTKILITCFSKN